MVTNFSSSIYVPSAHPPRARPETPSNRPLRLYSSNSLTPRLNFFFADSLLSLLPVPLLLLAPARSSSQTCPIPHPLNRLRSRHRHNHRHRFRQRQNIIYNAPQTPRPHLHRRPQPPRLPPAAVPRLVPHKLLLPRRVHLVSPAITLLPATLPGRRGPTLRRVRIPVRSPAPSPHPPHLRTHVEHRRAAQFTPSGLARRRPVREPLTCAIRAHTRHRRRCCLPDAPLTPLFPALLLRPLFPALATEHPAGVWSHFCVSPRSCAVCSHDASTTVNARAPSTHAPSICATPVSPVTQHPRTDGNPPPEGKSRACVQCQVRADSDFATPIFVWLLSFRLRFWVRVRLLHSLRNPTRSSVIGRGKRI